MGDLQAAGTVTVCRVDESCWRTYREVRLAMLRGAPRAFWTTYDEAAARPDDAWLAMVRDLDIWLAMRRDEPLGSVASFRLPERPEEECCLIAMWVYPQARGLGIGELLVQTVLDHAAAQGRSRVVLDVAHENAPAVALYERMGFEATGRTDVLPHDPSITEFEMARQVRPPGLDSAT
jgi:ribosomal protein S18 acetylase RimI-like enzyme